MKSFLRSRSARILTVVLFLQASAFYGFSRRENVPNHKPLSGFVFPPGSSWDSVQDIQLDKETLDVLKADDILSREYVDRNARAAATLFVAFFETQRTGKAPHSPKNCLPSRGWAPSNSGTTDVPI